MTEPQNGAPYSVSIDECKLKYTLYNAEGNVVQSDWADARPFLDNRIIDQICISILNESGVDNQMKYKINRQITYGGKTYWIHAQTEQEYAEKLMRLCMSGTETAREKHNFKTYALQWFETYSKPNVEVVTANTYHQQMTRYLFPWFGDENIEDITTDDVQKLFNSMDLAKSSKDKVKIVLNQILDAAVEDGIIPKSPLRSGRLKINGSASKETPPYTVEQMQFIVTRIGEVLQPQDRLFIALMALHPLRLEEALGLQWDDVDFANSMIHIRRAVTHPDRNQPIVKDTKTEQSVRTLALSKIAAGYLAEYKETAGFVIGGETPLSYTQVRRMCERIAKDIGFEERITPIRFRTTVLTDIYDQTKDLRLTQDSGGHTTPAMTLKRYVKGREPTARSAEAVDSLYAG